MKTDQRRPDRVQNFIIAILFALFVSLVPQMNRLAGAWKLPVLVLFLRYLFAFSGNICLQKAGVLHCSLKGKKKKPLLLLNAVFYVLAYALQAVGLIYAPSWLGAVMFATVPVWAEILAFIVLKEQPGFTETILVCISVAALVFMLTAGNGAGTGGITPAGFILLLLSAVSEACSNILIRYLHSEYSPAEISFSSCGLALSFVTVLLILTCIRDPGTVLRIQEAIRYPAFLLTSLYLGLFGTLGAGFLKAMLLARTSTLKASVWGNAASALSILFGVLLLKETLHSYQIVCCIVIAGSVLGIQAKKAKTTPAQGPHVRVFRSGL